MLNRWIDDIIEQAVALGLTKKEHHLALNQALYTLMQSPALNGVLADAQLQQSLSDPRQGRIFLPEYNEPLHSSFTIRNETVLDAALPMYHQDYYEYPSFHWGQFSPNGDMVTVQNRPLLPAAQTVLEALKQHDPRYEHLLNATDPDNEIEYTLLYQPDTLLTPIRPIPGLFMEPCDSVSDWLIDHIAMSEHDYGDIKSVWGHRYYSGSDGINNMLVAHTQTGIVGLLKLFNEPTQERWSSTPNPDKLNQHGLSFVSITPAFRGMGIASQLLSHALVFSLQQGKALYRTEPSEVGEQFLYERFTRLAQSQYPSVPFIEPGLESLTQQLFHKLNHHKIEVMEQSAIVSDILIHIRSNLNEEDTRSLMSRWSHINHDVIDSAESLLNEKIENHIEQKFEISK